MMDGTDTARGNCDSDRNPVNHCEKHGDRSDREEFEAAIAAVDAARAMTARMADAGMPIEDLGSEFLAERRALADLMVARHRMHELDRRLKSEDDAVNVIISNGVTRKNVVRYEIHLAGGGPAPPEAKYFDDAWHRAVADGLVDANRRSDYTFQLQRPKTLYESSL